MKLREKISPQASGFSLLEVIFAMTILSLGLAGFLTLFSEIAQSTLDDEFSMTGSRLAAQKLEEVLANKAAHGYSGVVNGTSEEEIRYDNRDFVRRTVIGWVNSEDLKTSSSSDTGFKRVDVTVTWNSGTSQQIQLTSLLTDY